MAVDKGRIVVGMILAAHYDGTRYLCNILKHPEKNDRVAFEVAGLQGIFTSPSAAGVAVLKSVGNRRTYTCNGYSFWTLADELEAQVAERAERKAAKGKAAEVTMEEVDGIEYPVEADISPADVAQAKVAADEPLADGEVWTSGYCRHAHHGRCPATVQDDNGGHTCGCKCHSPA